MKRLGLMLGAGASYELGMPLVWDVSREVRRWLTPKKLRMLNAQWRSHGTGHPDEVIDDLVKSLEDSSLHYESILGHLETQFMRGGPNRNAYHHLYSWLVEAVYVILQERHTRNVAYIQKDIKFYHGFKSLVPTDCPLWVFSLNHDMIVECLCAHYGIEVSAGFTTETVTFPRRDSSGSKIGVLQGQILQGQQLETSCMHFLGNDRPGVNLLKIHGSLDVFTFRDGKDLVRILPGEMSISGWIESLRAVNEELIYVDPNSPSGRIKTTNEITYADDSGEMQFLRRSLLSGAYKFDRRTSQVLPVKLLDHFKSSLNYVSSLVSFGYGFADDHINKIIVDWLAFSATRELRVVDPFRTTIPASLLHLARQVELVQKPMTDYLDDLSGIKRPKRELLEKQIGCWARKNQFNVAEKRDEFSRFMKDSLNKRMHACIGDIALLPIKNGDIDIQLTGLTPDELVKGMLEKNKVDIDALLEDFIKSQNR